MDIGLRIFHEKKWWEMRLKYFFEIAFSKMFFAARDIKEVDEFWLTYVMMTLNMTDYILDVNEEIRKLSRATMEG